MLCLIRTPFKTDEVNLCLYLRKTTSEMTNNFLTGYPECVDLRYFAASYHEKQKRQKLQEKLLITTSLDEEFFQIKRKPRKLNVFITEDNLYQICKICFKKEKVIYLLHIYYMFHSVNDDNCFYGVGSISE